MTKSTINISICRRDESDPSGPFVLRSGDTEYSGVFATAQDAEEAAVFKWLELNDDGA